MILLLSMKMGDPRSEDLFYAFAVETKEFQF